MIWGNSYVSRPVTVYEVKTFNLLKWFVDLQKYVDITTTSSTHASLDGILIAYMSDLSQTVFKRSTNDAFTRTNTHTHRHTMTDRNTDNSHKHKHGVTPAKAMGENATRLNSLKIWLG